jgi:hypothetical protein
LSERKAGEGLGNFLKSKVPAETDAIFKGLRYVGWVEKGFVAQEKRLFL